MSGAAVITGAAGALGRAIGGRLARDLDRVLLIDVASGGLEQAAAELRVEAGAAVATLNVDLTDPVAGEAVSRRLAELGWGVQVLVNNAGINRDARAGKMTEQQFRSVIAVDLLAPIRLATALRPLIGAGGSVVNIASRAALGSFGQANYVAAKSGLVAFTRALALAWAPQIRVNAIAPGLVDTPMTAGMPPQVLAKLVARVPAGRMAAPREIAEAVAFYASPEASYITGQMLLVCGGRSLAP